VSDVNNPVKFLVNNPIKNPVTNPDTNLDENGEKGTALHTCMWTCVPRRAHNGYGDRCFSAAGLSLWNSLALQLRKQDISFKRFKT